MRLGNLKSVLLTACTALTFIEAHAMSPSFDCGKASTPIEIRICANQELAELDVLLMQAYKQARTFSKEPSELQREQLQWLRRNRDTCQTDECIQTAMLTRISELQLVTLSPEKTEANANPSPSAPTDQGKLEFHNLMQSEDSPAEKPTPGAPTTEVEHPKTDARSTSAATENEPSIQNTAEPTTKQKNDSGDVEMYTLLGLMLASLITTIIFRNKAIVFANKGDYFASTAIAFFALLIGLGNENGSLGVLSGYLIIQATISCFVNKNIKYGLIGTISRAFVGVTAGLLSLMSQTRSEKVRGELQNARINSRIGHGSINAHAQAAERISDYDRRKKFAEQNIINPFLFNAEAVRETRAAALSST